jgi:hypothetical protein
MTDTLALEYAYNAVVAQFATDGVACLQPFGWAKSGQHLTGPRIVWVPGDPSGAAGTITGAMNVGTIPKPLFTFNEVFHVIISGYGDETDPVDELKAWKITRLLHDQWMRAMERNLKGMYQLTRQDWVRAGERDYVRFGTALIVVAAIQSAVLDTGPDGPITEVYPGAEILVHELDYTETVIVPPHPPPPTPTP